MLPRHLKVPLTMTASLVHRASHSSILGERTVIKKQLGHHYECMLPVRGEDDASPLSCDVGEDVPQVAPCGGVHAGGGLVLFMCMSHDMVYTTCE